MASPERYRYRASRTSRFYGVGGKHGIFILIIFSALRVLSGQKNTLRPFKLHKE